MEFVEVVHVFVDFRWGRIRHGLDFNLNNVPWLINGIDRPFATVAGVMDHEQITQPWECLST